jgi:hypothetical protein
MEELTPREALQFLAELQRTDPKYHKFLTEDLGYDIKDSRSRESLYHARRMGKDRYVKNQLGRVLNRNGNNWNKVPDYFDPLLSDADLEFKNNKKRAAWGEANTNKATPKITSEPVNVRTGDPDLVSDVGRNPSAKVPEQRGVYGPLVAKPVDTSTLGADPSAASKDAAARGLLSPEKSTVADPSISNVSEARSSGLLDPGKKLREFVDEDIVDSKVTKMTSAEARAHFKNRDAGAQLFYTPKDWEAYAVMKAQVKDGGAAAGGEVRWNDYSKQYKDFSRRTTQYNNLVRDYAMKQRASGAMTDVEHEAFLKKYRVSEGHLGAKNMRGTAHLRDVDANLIWENLSENIDSKARASFASFVNGMGRSAETGIRVSQSELDKIDGFSELTRSHPVDGFDSESLRGIREKVGRMDRFTPMIDEVDPRYNQAMFTGHGNFRPYSAPVTYKADGTISSQGGMLEMGIVKNEAEFEKIRRLAITMLSGDPEFDLDGHVSNMQMTKGNQQFVSGLYENDVGWEEIRRGNRPVSEQYFTKKQKIMKLLKKSPWGILGILGSAGATYAADDGFSEGSDEEYLDHVLRKLELYDNLVAKPGRDKIMTAADHMKFGDFLRNVDDNVNESFMSIPEAEGGWKNPLNWNKYASQFIYGAAKDWPGEVVGLWSGPDREVLEENGLGSNGSWADRQKQVITNEQQLAVQRSQGDPSLQNYVAPMPNVNQVPHNVEPLYQQANPHLKYGGVLQSDW